MSEYKTKIMLGAVLAVIIAVGLAGATILVAPQPGTGISTQSQQSSLNTSQQLLSTSTALQSASSTGASSVAVSSTSASSVGASLESASPVLIIQLTDPPIVPFGTTSLNLTYSAINLLVTVPSTTSTTSTTSSASTTSSSTSTSTAKITSTSTSQVTAQTITLTPTGGSATVDLLKLQNISQTLASAKLPNGSEIYSVSFVVSSISIKINGVVSPVTLATGGNTLLVTLTTPAAVRGTVALLLDLTPTIINTSTGYEMIPSSIGIIVPQIEITPQYNQTGYTHNLTNQDQIVIKQAFGHATATFVGLSVSGNTSTITVQVANTGNASVQIVSIAVSGNFTALNCVTTTTSSTANHGGIGDPDQQQRNCETTNEVVFVPNVPTGSSTSTSTTKTSSTSSSSTKSTSSTTTKTTSSASTVATCTTGKMTLANIGYGGISQNELTLAPGQCVTLTFSGVISLGPPSNVIVPSTLAGQKYTVQVITFGPQPTPCMQLFTQMSCQGNSGDNEQGNPGNNGPGNFGNNGRR